MINAFLVTLMDKDNQAVVYVKWVLAALAGIWVSVPAAVQLLCVLSVVDFGTALFDYHTSLRDLTKRLVLAIILTLSVHYCYTMAKAQVGLNLGFDVATVVASFYSLGEILAVMRNCARVGVRMPPRLIDLLSKAEGLTLEDKQELDALREKQTTVATAELQRVAEKAAAERERGVDTQG